MLYKCINCGKNVEIDLKAAKKVQCAYCGYRILEKIRPPVVKKVQAI